MLSLVCGPSDEVLNSSTSVHVHTEFIHLCLSPSKWWRSLSCPPFYSYLSNSAIATAMYVKAGPEPLYAHATRPHIGSKVSDFIGHAQQQLADLCRGYTLFERHKWLICSAKNKHRRECQCLSKILG
jgi:hypothetical protein